MSLLLSLLIALNPTQAEACTNHTTAKYEAEKDLSDCGDKVYPNCDDPKGKNQLTIYQDAKQVAIANRKKLLIIVGADWCGYCLKFEKALHSDANAETLKELKSKMVIVNIKGDNISGRQLAKHLGVSIIGFPTALYVNPESEIIMNQFVPTMFTQNMAKMVTFLSPSTVAKAPEAKDYYGSASAELLQKPIKIETGFATNNWLDPSDESNQFVNQGMAMLHVFHYADAYRSFLTATKINPDNIYGYVGQMITGMNLSGDHLAFNAQTKANELYSSLTDIEKAWVDFAKAHYKKNANMYAYNPNDQVLGLSKAFANLKQTAPNDVEVLVLGAYLVNSSDEASFKTALKINPNHAGAYHYLNHTYEVQSDYAKTAIYAKKLAELAPASAHAQHMYGHILPRLGRWKEALEQFKKADKIHQDWSKRNEVKPSEDWHYSHNNDLMGVTLALLGRPKDARERLISACKSDKRACVTWGQMMVALGKIDEASSDMKRITSASQKWADYMAAESFVLSVLEGSKNVSDITTHAEMIKKRRGGAELLEAINAINNNWVDDSVPAAVNKYIDGLLKDSHGFDSWKHGVFKAIMIFKLLEKSNRPLQVKQAVANHLNQYLPGYSKIILAVQP